MNSDDLNRLIDKLNINSKSAFDDEETISLLKNLKDLKDTYYKDKDVIESIKAKRRRKSSLIAATLIFFTSIQLFNLPLIGTKIGDGTLSPSYNVVYAMQKTYDSVKTIVLDTNMVEINIKNNKVIKKEFWKEIYAGPLSYRMEGYDQILIADGTKTLNYDKKAKKGVLKWTNPLASPVLELKSQVDDIYKYGNYKLVGSENLDGIDTNVIKVETKIKKSKAKVRIKTDTYWIDKKTNFIVKHEELNGDVKRIVTYNIDFNTLVNKDDLKPNLPEDVYVYNTFDNMYIFNSIEAAKKASDNDVIIPDKLPTGLKFFNAWKYKKDPNPSNPYNHSIQLCYYNEDYTKVVYIEEFKKGDKILVKISTNFVHGELKPTIDDLKSRYRNIDITLSKSSVY
ncbi:hypothetical protein PGH24_05575 [Thermoanaerobacterium thermosaccharolyticum]|uniref:LolA family protein n=1 Tax=Thermoanaerobacterium thermosaccharolyticum TaxID=1517 RepID=UPI00279ED6E0|nr:hypothetical protein PGH24_05575 [Thermoanaerobacterium thermosaccharolyticum]